MNKISILIPVYNHPDSLAAVVEQLSIYSLDCLLVNDGSDAHCSDTMRHLAQAHEFITLLERSHNGGKGAAMKTGLAHLKSAGYSHALQVDADGQHCLADIPAMLTLAQQHPRAVISGAPHFDNAPAIRYYGRYLTHIWVWINTLSLDIRDSMCGFRVYPLTSTCATLDTSYCGDRMDFDSEILVRLHWAGVQVIHFDTLVDYPVDGISHFRSFRDNVLISAMHTRLFFGMLRRSPALLHRRWSNRG